MSSRLAELREKSKRRKEYLKVTLGVDNLSEALGSDKTEPQASRRRLDSDKEEVRCEECPQEAEAGATGGQEADTEFRDSTDQPGHSTIRPCDSAKRRVIRGNGRNV